jgi:prolyl-tRNA synthetase
MGAAAPYHVSLVSLRRGSDRAESLCASLRDSGVEVLYDDREESPGVKFADADLIGLPLRLRTSSSHVTSPWVGAAVEPPTDGVEPGAVARRRA